MPLADYESLEPWIHRIRRGETSVLTAEPVTHLVPTSGSAGTQKLIPFTKQLQGEFNAAVAAWLVDLLRRQPRLIAGPAYWSITPSLHQTQEEESAVPIGFDADTAYLGGTRRWLAEAVMAVPPSIQRADNIESFRYETLLHLLRCRDLRLISVWHPSLLSVLFDALAKDWRRLLADVSRGNASLAPMPRRADELRAIGPQNVGRFWPYLRLISSWGGGSAESVLGILQSQFPQVTIQRKGLLATEGVVTIPFCESQPLAITSHFFEFIDDDGKISLAHELQKEREYEVVITTGGGLWRYRLGDKVRVNGFLGETPSLAFLGRIGGISDQCGEKLSEAFVSRAIEEATTELPPLRFALLAPDGEEGNARYTLYAEGRLEPDVATRLDAILRGNPHYAWCRELGQLRAPRIFRINSGGFDAFIARQTKNGNRIGDVKPCSLSTQTGWSAHFQGDYVG